LFFDLGKILAQMGFLELLLMYVFLYSIGVSMMLVLFRANGYLFHYKDYEILAPLPIKPKTVLFAKATIMLLTIYFGLVIFISPIAFAYFYYTGFSIFSFLIFLLSFPFIPLIPVIIFSFLSMLIARATSRFRKSNILNIILMLLVFMGIMAFSMSFSFSGGSNPLLNQQDLITGMKDIYLPMGWFTDAVHNRNILSFFLLIVSNAVPFYLFMILIQKMAVKTNQKGMTVVTRKNNKPVRYQARSLFYTLIIKEVRKFFNVPIYAVNAGIGPLFLGIAGIVSLILKEKILAVIPELNALGVGVELIILIFICFCLSTIYTSAINLSLEGKNFWIIKSLPIKPSLVMSAKMAFNILLGLPIALICLVLFSISLSITLVNFLVLVLVVSSFSLMTSALGSFVNLHFPKFEYMNDTEVVKQSVGAMIGVLGGMGFIVINGFGYYFLDKIISWQLALILISVLNFGIFAFFFTLVESQSNKLFAKMSG